MHCRVASPADTLGMERRVDKSIVNVNMLLLAVLHEKNIVRGMAYEYDSRRTHLLGFWLGSPIVVIFGWRSCCWTVPLVLGFSVDVLGMFDILCVLCYVSATVSV